MSDTPHEAQPAKTEVQSERPLQTDEQEPPTAGMSPPDAPDIIEEVSIARIL